MRCAGATTWVYSLARVVLPFLLCTAIGQAAPPSPPPLDDLTSVYATSGEAGVRERAAVLKDSLVATDIIKRALNAVEQRNAASLAVARILAEVAGDPRVLADVFVQTARFGLAASDYALVDASLDKALKFYRESHNGVGEAHVHRLRGDVAAKRGDKAQALDAYKTALGLYTSAENLAEQGTMHRNIGDLLAGSGDDSGALEHYRGALACYEKTGAYLGAGNVSQGMGELLLKKKNTDAALTSFAQARASYEKAGNYLGQGNALYRTGEIAVRKKQDKEALDAFMQALYFYEKAESRPSVLNVRQSLANLHGVMGDALFRGGEYRTALEHYQKGLALLGQEGRPSDAASLYRNAADTLLKLENLVQADEYYAKALQEYEKSGNKTALASVHRKRGDIFRRQGKSAEAVASYELAHAWYEKKGDHALAAAMYRLAGTALREAKELGRAQGYYEKALVLLEGSKNSQEIAELCVLLGELAAETGNVQQALAVYEKGLSQSGAGDSKVRGYLYRNLAHLYTATGDNDKALDCANKALQIFIALGDHNEQGVVLLGEGNLYLKRGDNQKAAECFAKAREQFRVPGNEAGQGYALRGEGEVLYLSGNPAGAKERFDSALALFVKVKDLRGQGAVHRNLGDLSILNGANAAALESYRSAFAFYQEAGDTQGMGNSYRSQADALARMGDTARAMDLQVKARALLAKVDDTLGNAHELRSQGDIYLRTGNNVRAMELYREALALYHKAGDLSAQGNVIRIIGNVHFQSGDYAGALIEYDRALPMLEKSADLPGQGNIFQSRGDIAYMKGDFATALKLYAQALSLFEKCSDPLGQANVFKSQADVYTMLNDHGNAMRLYRSALNFYVKAGDTESQAYTTLGMAKIASQDKSPEGALPYYTEGIALLEKVRTQSTLSQLKKGFMEKVYDYYEEATVFMLKNKLPDEAFRLAESMKARVFIDQLSEGNVNLEQGVDPQLRAAEAVLQTRIAGLNKQIAEKSGDPLTASAVAMLQQSLSQAERERNDIRIRIRLGNPMYGSVHYAEPVTIKKLQDDILAANEVLLEYVVSGESIYCFVVTAKNTQTYTLPLTKKELDRYIEELIESVKIGPSRNPTQLGTLSKKLYDALVRPLQDHLHKRSILLIPDGLLARIPFEILIRHETDELSYLIEKNPLKYFQSATFLTLQRTVLKKAKRGSSFIGFGDPVYDYPAFSAKRLETASASGSTLARLEASGREVRAIKGIFEGQNLTARALLREEAREEYAKSPDMKEYGYIHFAAHGITDAKHQAIALSRVPGAADDGYLSIGEIMKSSYAAARMVVLSACQSGLGELDRGEGVTGLTRAVMYAGSPAAVVSLWSISDTATKTLMEKLYENIIARSLTLEEALRAAKLEMIRERNFRHPLFWGAFVMYGE